LGLVRGRPRTATRPAPRARGADAVGGRACGLSKTADFLLENTFDGDHFSFIGSQGWYPRGGTRATFDQQPVDAAATVMMLRAAYDVMKDSKFLVLQRTAFDWFLGTNDLRVPLYDFGKGGLLDGSWRRRGDRARGRGQLC
jgi:hypothetical protein